MSRGNKFSHLALVPTDPYFQLKHEFFADTHENKVYLGEGEYKAEDGQLYYFEVVKEAERAIFEDEKIDKEYLPIEGLASFNTLIREVIFGVDCPAVIENRVVTLQSISGAGAIRLGAECLKAFVDPPCAYISDYTWPSQKFLFEAAGIPVKTYPYWHPVSCEVDFPKMLLFLNEAPEGSVIVLHPCAHNPTGIDPNPSQWDELAEFFQNKNFIIFFDAAYQGFASGDMDADFYSIRSFVNKGLYVVVSYSCSKIFGMYSDRIGSLNIVCPDTTTAEAVLSQAKGFARAMYSSPPKYGALVVQRILSDPELRRKWLIELNSLAERLIGIRKKMYEELVKVGLDQWDHIIDQKGMFWFTGLTPAQAQIMNDKWHCYCSKLGRISISALKDQNMAYVARALKDSAENY